jgi:hypothetical protein
MIIIYLLGAIFGFIIAEIDLNRLEEEENKIASLESRINVGFMGAIFWFYFVYIKICYWIDDNLLGISVRDED